MTPRKSAFTPSPGPANKQRSAAKVMIRNKNGASTAGTRRICAITRMTWIGHRASNASIDIKDKRSIKLLVRTNEKSNQVLLNDTLHVQELRTNLMSVAKIIDHGFKVIFDNQKAEIVDLNNQMKVIAKREKNLYFVRGKPGENNSRVETANQASEGPLRMWHDRLGHLNLHNLCEAIERGAMSGISGPNWAVKFASR